MNEPNVNYEWCKKCKEETRWELEDIVTDKYLDRAEVWQCQECLDTHYRPIR